MIEIGGLRKDYGSVVALHDTELSVPTGEFLTLLGPSGSGKTTLLNLIAGMAAPTRGRIVINGRDVTDVPAEKRGLGMVFQNYALMPHMTVSENIAFPLEIRKVPRARFAGGSPRCWSSCVCRMSGIASRKSSRAVNSSASRSPAASSTSRISS